MKRNIDCRIARQLMDRREWLEGGEGAELQEHLAACPSCAREASVEAQLREVISPATLPAPGNAESFERTLRMRLGIVPRAARPDPFAQWGWVVGALTLTALVAPLVYTAWESLLHYAAVITAAAGAILRPTTALTAPVMERADLLMPNLGGALTVNLILAALLLIGSLAAYRMVSE